MRMFAVACLILPDLEEQLPQDREENALQAIGNDPRLQSTPEKTSSSVLTDDAPCSFGVRHSSFVHLSIRLDYTQRVRDRI